MSDENSLKRFFQFKKKPNDETQTIDSFDEGSFSFELKGSGLNTSLIEASATMKKGKYIGMPLPLRCTWYRATDEKEFVTIEGVSGAFYQPNADDIGCKICVHAVPVSEIEEYTGMPAFSEIGPIKLDPHLQTAIQEILSKDQVSFNVLVSGEKGANSNKPASILLEKDKICITTQEGLVVFNGMLTGDSLKSNINHKSNNTFFLTSLDTKVKLVAEKPHERDMIVICIRMFGSKSCTTDLSQVLLKNQQLSIRLFEANQRYEQTLIAINLLKEEATDKSGDVEYYQTQNRELERVVGELKESYEKLRNQYENCASENIFLRKDLLVYKEQCSLLENKLKSQSAEEIKCNVQLLSIKDDLESLAKVMICGSCKIDERLYKIIDRITGNTSRIHSSHTSSVVSYQDDISDHSEQMNLEETKLHSGQVKLIKEETTESIDKLEAEKNFFKRKADSLSVENEKLLTRLGKNPKDISEFQQEREVFEESKYKLLKELEDTKQKVTNSEKLLKINKRKLDSEIERNFELRKLLQSKGSNSATDYQRIVNSLTQTLSEREEELSKQKSLNKDFMNRIAQLEARRALIPT